MKKCLDMFVKIYLIVLGCTFLFPLFWMINLSFKTKSEVYDNPFGFPHIIDLTNYSEVLESFKFVKYFTNSSIYVIGTILITLALGSMLAYSLARMGWKHSNLFLTYISTGLIIPVQVVIIPLYIILKSLHLKDTYFGLIVPYSAFALPSCVLMLYAFFRTLPKELEEAACIDGCNVYQSFLHIILPLIKPAFATQIILIFMGTWNEFFFALIIAGKEEFRSLPVGLLDFFVAIGVADWGLIGAAMLMVSLPTIIIFLIGNEQIEKALTMDSGIK